MLFKLSLGAIGILLVGLGWQTQRLDNAQARGLENEVQLAACGARLSNLIEDLKSDAEIDRLPNDALRTVPSHWLQPTGD